MNIKNSIHFFHLIGMLYLTSCADFLDAKPEASISTPEKLKDLRALLDEENKINRHFPGLIEMGTDNYFIDHNVYSALPNFDQNVYIWAAEAQFLPADMIHWNNTYAAVMTANVVLESLSRLSEGSDSTRRIIKGEALFVRGYAFFYLAQIYCAPFLIGKMNDGLGIPLRLTSDFNVPTNRASIDGTYSRIIQDLEEAADLLPDRVDYLTRASKTAAYAALSKVFLSMADYDKALGYVEKALSGEVKLLDYNELNMGGQYTFAEMHDETIYFAFTAAANKLLIRSRANVPNELYNSYSINDLRKEAYYYDKGNGRIGFRGNYAGNNSSYFAGLATDELYLIQSECYARSGQTDRAMQILNSLLITRWRTGTFVPLRAVSSEDALRIVLKERRKSLVHRGVRWSDLRRLNQDARFATTLTRIIDDGTSRQNYQLPPNDPRYTYPIPQEVIAITGMPQNSR